MRKVILLCVTILLLIPSGRCFCQTLDTQQLLYDLFVIDSTNNVIIVEMEKKGDTDKDPVTGEYRSILSMREAFGEAKKAWDGFVEICTNQEFEKANKILIDDEFKDKVFRHLRAPKQRYDFINKIFTPISVFNNTDSGVDWEELMKWREKEYLIEYRTKVESSIIYDHYIPLLRDLAMNYTVFGMMDDVFYITDEIKSALLQMEKDSIFTEIICDAYLRAILDLVGDSITSKKIESNIEEIDLSSYDKSEEFEQGVNEILDLFEISREAFWENLDIIMRKKEDSPINDSSE